MNEYETSPLYRIMHPRSVAFWGASKNPMGMGSVLLSQMQAIGFSGALYPIHPRDEEIAGLTAYQSIADVPGPVDLAVLVLPTHLVPDIFEQLGKARVKYAIVVSGGFAEMGYHGKQLQERIISIAAENGIHFLGPNCIGVANPRERINTTFCTYEGGPGYIGLASQSGSFVTQMFEYLYQFDLGFSQALSVGNEAQIDLTDCIAYLGDCPDTRAIGLYIEAIRRGPEFLKTAREVSKKKPIVAYYVGGSDAGSRAALSHTGALAGPDALYDGIFRQAGIVRASCIEELFDFCTVLGTQPLPRGDRVAIQTHSGGPGAAAADAAGRCGLELTAFSPNTLEALKEVVPHTASISNPVDLTFNRHPEDYTEKIPEILLRDSNVDGLFIYLLLTNDRVRKTIAALTHKPDMVGALAEQFITSQAVALTRLMPKSGKPVVGGSFTARTEPFIKKLQTAGFPVLPSPERGVRALGALVQYADWRRRVGSDTISR